jgi:eukaryotic-like serine/threonine-protein kinase
VGDATLGSVSDLRFALGAALGPVYMVEREVRPIGGCRLFVALELPGGAEVLVKVLPGELSLAVDPARFERELQLLTDRLGDPNLVAPCGGGRAGLFVYHTRRFVEGTTLRAELARHGELPLHRAVEILRSVLVALTHAHGKNVAHGDLKPENVLLAEGQVLVVDTGVVDAIGRSLVSGAPGAARAALGAPAYLPPEHRRGDNGAGPGPGDDMFAVGVLAHEMLTGQPPAPESESLDEVRAVPSWFRELIRRCLTAGPAGRWGDAAAALASLSRASWGG